MGPGIFTKYSKRVLGGALALLALTAAAGLYIRSRSPVGGVSPYETVNDLCGQERISLTVQQNVYPADVETVQLTIRNDAEDTVVGPTPYCPDEWLLEMQVDGVWHSMRLSPLTAEEHVKWAFPPEEYGPNSGPSGIVKWGGGEQRYLCRIAAYYQTPLEPGLYRIVFPQMEHRNVAALAVEFEVA